MEVAGLAVGVIGLIGLFKDCADLLSLISIARDLGKDAEVLQTKLDIERMIFLQ